MTWIVQVSVYCGWESTFCLSVILPRDKKAASEKQWSNVKYFLTPHFVCSQVVIWCFLVLWVGNNGLKAPSNNWPYGLSDRVSLDTLLVIVILSLCNCWGHNTVHTSYAVKLRTVKWWILSAWFGQRNIEGPTIKLFKKEICFSECKWQTALCVGIMCSDIDVLNNFKNKSRTLSPIHRALWACSVDLFNLLCATAQLPAVTLPSVH